MQTLTIEDLAFILNRSPATVATEVTKFPEKLPPRFYLPNSRRVLFLKEDVDNWMREQQEKSKELNAKKKARRRVARG